MTLFLGFLIPDGAGRVSTTFDLPILEPVRAVVGVAVPGLIGLLCLGTFFLVAHRPQTIGIAISRSGLFLPLLLAHVLWNLIIGLGGTSPVSYVLGNAQFLVAYVIALGAAACEFRATTRFVLDSMKYAFTLPAIYIIITFVSVGFTRNPDGTRLLSEGAVFTIVAMALWFADFLHGKRYHLAPFLMCLFSTYLSGTRSFMAAAALALLIVVFAVFKGRQRMVMVGALIAAATLMILFPLGDSLGSTLSGRSVDTLYTSDSYRDRLGEDLAHAFEQSPIIGEGYGFVASTSFAKQNFAEIARPYIVELSYNNLLVKSGIVGTLLAAGAFLSVFRRATQWILDSSHAPERAYRAAPLAGIAALMAVAIANPILESIYFHLLVATVAFLPRLDSDAAATVEPRQRGV